MIVLTAVSAGLYALTLIPFKGFQLIPGIAELRPAAVLPPLLGILFGPAGAWGCAIGNTLGDYVGKTLTEGSAFGALGNFCFALVAYRLWCQDNRQESIGDFSLANPQHWGKYVSVCVLACSSVALIIAWGLEFLKLGAFATTGSVILLNNLAATLILGPFLFKLFYSRSKAWGFLWFDIMPAEERTTQRSDTWTNRLLWIGAIGGLTTGLFVSHVLYQNPFLESAAITNDPAVLWFTGPFLLVFLLGVVLD